MIAHQSLLICAFPLRATEYGLERSWWCVALSNDERTVCSSGERSVFTHDNDNIITEAQTFTEKLSFFASVSYLPYFLFSSFRSCQFHRPSQTPYLLPSFLSKTKLDCQSFRLQHCLPVTYNISCHASFQRTTAQNISGMQWTSRMRRQWNKHKALPG